MLSKIFKEDIDIVKLFADECKECLDDLEKNILKLETCPEDIGLTDSIFTGIHGIKISSSFAGLPIITRLCREIELLLEAVRIRRITVSKEVIDSLLLSGDFLDAYISGLYKKLAEFDTYKGAQEFLEFQSEQDQEQVLLSLKQAYESCLAEGYNIIDNKISEETELKNLQSEEFKQGLTEGIREQFLVESTEHVEKIENDLLIRLDADGSDKETISELFRAVHSIKGGAGVYLSTLSARCPEYSSLKKLSEIAHNFENLLALVRDKGLNFENRLINLGFLVIDHLKSCIGSVASGKFIDLKIDNILEEIREHISRVQSLTIDSLPKAPATTQELKKTDENGHPNSITQSIRVSQEKIDRMMNMISELIIAKNSFMHISSKLNAEYDLSEISKEVKQVGSYINRISDELQDTVMSIRMVEIKAVFQKMPRVVRDIAHSTGKKIELLMEGENTELDKTIIEQISDPLVHLIRNAADHGIEDPKERISKGKPETGRIVLRAYNKSKHVFIEIEDDGNGMDTEKIKEKAIRKGFVTSEEAERMNRSQLLNLIFIPGFSTAKQITEISGRGVGMDIVKSNIAKLNGSIMIESEKGKGTKIIVKLPLSLAVSHGLTVEVSGETYIFPLEYIIETVKLNKSSLHTYSGKCFTYLRGDVIRVEWLSKLFGIGDTDHEKEELNAVILTNGTENFAIVVDKLKNEQEFVVKTLEGNLAFIPGISGSTLLGNGKVVLIVNPDNILQLADKETWGLDFAGHNEYSSQSAILTGIIQ